MPREIVLRVRYLPAAAEVCDVFSEELIRHKYLTWPLPVAETALVAVDTWDCHYLSSHQKRTAKIASQKIKPVMDACRKAGIAVIHAPSPEDARGYQWPLPYFPSGGQDFEKNKIFLDEKFKKPAGKALAVWNEMKVGRRILKDIEPQDGDYIIATGKELRRLCRNKRVSHLLYAGFAANWCVLFRDYGLREMVLEGYNAILLRDCTTAVENAYTIKNKSMTRWAILEAEEVFRAATATSKDFIKACEDAK